MTTVDDQLLTVPEVADYLRCKEWTARRLMSAGEVRSSKVAGRLVAYRSAVIAYVESQRTSHTDATQAQRRRRRRAS